MEKFICDKCGTVVDEIPTVRYTEHHPYGDGAAPESHAEEQPCPCGGEWEEALECEICREWVEADVDKTVGGRVCQHCFDECDNLDRRVQYAKSEHWISFIIGYFWEWSIPNEVERTVPSEVLTELSEPFYEMLEHRLPRYRDKAIEPLNRFVEDDISDYAAWLAEEVTK